MEISTMKYWLLTLLLLPLTVMAQNNCLSPAGPIGLNTQPQNCYIIPATDTVERCFTFTSPGTILLFTSVPPGFCLSLSVTAQLYDSACNLVTPNAFGVVFTVPGNAYTWCVKYICIGTHDTIYCPSYQDFSALPVEWLSFDATYYESLDFTKLRWSTASEQNNDFFEVQRSVTGERFSSVGRLPGAGTTNTPQHYKFNDQHPPEGVNFYRVAQVDDNGDKRYSNPVMIIKPLELQNSWRVFDAQLRFLGTMKMEEIKKLQRGVYILKKGTTYKKIVR